ncbi:hypothetical protein BP5796_08783 [Coleophoma crateriformis]|uniref:Uncharacterized protein n=1 Tax=Coleophoma crateriformis TaxID=565419 RepID=A0A3D8R8S2_9HELO|nr:hypothetical protein BP5796_08783 [Coleophoma crateriformis]
MIVIGALLRLSEAHDGFANAPKDSIFPASVQRFLITTDVLSGSAWSFLWSVIPTLTFTLFSLYWGVIVSDLQDRQPFVELGSGKGGNGKQTVLLDYRQSFGLIRWFRAFQNGHYILGVALVLQIIVSFALVPLASHLFVASDIVRATGTNMLVTMSFNGSAFNSKSDITSILSLVSATRNLNASFPPWT